MSRSWIGRDRRSIEYRAGVNNFFEFANAHGAIDNGRLKCPCIKCNNVLYQDIETTRDHIICDGFVQNYNIWHYHGETTRLVDTYVAKDVTGPCNDQIDRDDELVDLVHDLFGVPNLDDSNIGQAHDMADDPNPEDTSAFYRLIEDTKQPLYTGCEEHTKLSFILNLYHIKCLNGWSNKSFTMLLELLRKVLPEGSTLPKNFYQAKKIISDLGLNYNKIDACVNDCMLYWKESAHKESCDTCGESRWKTEEAVNKNKTPQKILRHFPLKPRLQRLFMSSKTAGEMRWHDEERTKDGLLRHPADSPAWKDFDKEHPNFALEPRNVRLGLASDGFNPFRTMSINYSIWPVVLIPYNLPPWVCMKQSNLILSLIIPGPSGPGNDIDVYMRPLIDELNDLWENGVRTRDASKKDTFMMHASLLWTISDFPGYAILSGWSTKGKLACPSCHKDTCSRYLQNARKQCYMGHRRLLPPDHRFRRSKATFDGTIELGCAPTPLSGSDVLQQLNGYQCIFGKKKKKKRSRHTDDQTTGSYNWKKQSIFFELPYWKDNLLRHNLDVMHIEKNVCDNVVGTLLNLDGKTKDSLKARLDLVHMGVKYALHPQLQPDSSKVYIPPALYSMDKKEKEIFCEVLKSVTVPDGYSSNIARRINIKERKISGLKSHDSHVIMQQFLPLALRKSLPDKKVCSALIELSNFFHAICSKVCREDELKRLEEKIALTLVHLERIFPPAFFDIMVHLPVHLANEARLGGPVQYRWMYPIERYLSTLKSYVRNRAQPEGCIAEGYLANECLTFCSRYLGNVETRMTRPTRYEDESTMGRAKLFSLTELEWEQAHRYVLFNSDKVDEYREQHLRIIRCITTRTMPPHELQRKHNEQFVGWFKTHVQTLIDAKRPVPDDIRLLSYGPDTNAKKFNGYVINGFKFRTKTKEMGRKSQNSGVMVTAATDMYASSRDKTPIVGDLTYYGRLTEIIQLTYSGKLDFVLFKCDWVDVKAVGRAIKTDEYGMTLVDLTRLLPPDSVTHEPYVLATQAEQVFYVQDPTEPNWHVVIKTKPRDYFNMNEESVMDDNAFRENDPFGDQHLDGIEENEELVQVGVTGVIVDAPRSMLQGDTPNADFIDEDVGSGSDAQLEGEDMEDDEP